MTNPTEPAFYPPQPPSGIGQFVVGKSQIGDLNAFDWKKTIYSQYGNSTKLLTLLEAFNACVDQTANLSNFYDLIWNLDTAVGIGLDIWGRIVGVQRQLNVSAGDFFGFQQALPDITTFGFGIFFSGQPATTNVSLTDQAFRQLIIAKALANICDGSIESINSVLLTMFAGRGDCWVADNQNMSLTYTFRFTLSSLDIAIISQSGVLPRSCGCSASFAEV